MNIVGKTDVGMIRTKNEDTLRFGSFPDGTFWALVCDGMGGASAGLLASTMTADMVSEKISKCYNTSMSVSSLENLLLSAITTANVTVFDRSDIDDELRGMGTTIVAAIYKNSEVCIAHVGDSRAYLISKGDKITLLTKDHSLAQQMYDMGKITKEEFDNHPRKNIITRAIGVGEEIEIDFDFVCLEKDDALILCSDGMSGTLNEEEILDIYNKTVFEGLADEYIKRANQKGGKDNITVVVMKG